MPLLALADSEQIYRYKLLDTAPNAELKAEIEDAFQRSKELHILYILPERMEPAPYHKGKISRSWQYSLRYRCAYSCSGSFDGVRQNMILGRRIDGACPNGFALSIAFIGRDDELVLQADFSLSGLCMMIEERSYILPEKASVGALVRSALSILSEGSDASKCHTLPARTEEEPIYEPGSD